MGHQAFFCSRLNLWTDMSFDANANPQEIRYEFTQPHRPEMAEFGKRVETYLPNWPNNTNALPCQFASAGFYYTGIRDKVRCFYCNISLQQWHKNDDPWFEHAKASPTCGYLISQKGQQFVQDVLQTVSVENESTQNATARTHPTRTARRNNDQNRNRRRPERNRSQLNTATNPNPAGNRCALCAFVRSHALIILAFAFAYFIFSRF